jgi:hypothetical protein
LKEGGLKIMRNSFVFYISWWEAIKNLPRDVQGDVLTAIIEYGLYGETTEQLKPIAKAMLAMAKSQIDINNQRFENGKKGGRPKPDNNQKGTKQKTNYNQNQTKEEPNNNLINNDNVNDINKESPNGDKKTIPKSKEVDLSFVSDEFKDVFKEWLEYKRERKENYKSEKSLKMCYNRLLTLSGNDCNKAKLVVEQSVASNYAGLFELKNYGAKQHTDIYEQKRIDSERRKSRLMAEFAEADAKFLAEQEAKRKAVGATGEIPHALPDGG